MKNSLFYLFSTYFLVFSFHFDDSTGYQSYDILFNRFVETIEKINSFWILKNENKIAFKQVVGKSYLKRQMFSINVGNCDISTPSIILTGLHHAREGPTVYVILGYLEYILDQIKKNDRTMITLLKNRCIVAIPIVNPDTYDANVKRFLSSRRYGDGRKNQHVTCQKGLRGGKGRSSNCREQGVDLNRNYPICFGRDSKGSSQQPGAEDYEGNSPFSEPETQAVKTVVESRHFSIGINFHSYGKLVSIPYACKAMGNTLPGKDEETLQFVSGTIAKLARYTYKRPWQDPTLYPVNGETSDWMYQNNKIIAMSIELSPSYPSSNGFWPAKFGEIVDEMISPLLFATEASGTLFSIKVIDGQTIKIVNEGLLPSSSIILYVPSSKQKINVKSISQRGESDPIQLSTSSVNKFNIIDGTTICTTFTSSGNGFTKSSITNEIKNCLGENVRYLNEISSNTTTQPTLPTTPIPTTPTPKTPQNILATSLLVLAFIIIMIIIIWKGYTLFQRQPTEYRPVSSDGP